jgi:HAD superfamily hydrolase (TIGR01456 family)
MASSLRPLASKATASAFRRVSTSRCSPHLLRGFQTSSPPQPPRIPDFAFAFDIDGVLVRSSTPIPGASDALKYLQQNRIPFILLTNGGGKSESERVADLSEKLGLDLDVGLFMQSHTPFADLHEYKGADKTVLVVGGDEDKCQTVARDHYGFQNVVTPGDIVTAYPHIWPFSKVFLPYYQRFAKPLPKPIHVPGQTYLEDSLKIDAIFVYNDPRDWGLDSSIILDLLLSHSGYLGTLSKKNGDSSLPQRGYQQDSQPPLYYSNPDLWWAASYHLPRLGQGAFRLAFDGLWSSITGGVELQKTIIGKPHQPTYEFAENLLRRHRKRLFGNVGLNDPLRRVYMVGDNPESDIRGANSYQSPHGSQWKSVLVRTGVYQEGTQPAEGAEPTIVVKDVHEAVQWAVEDARNGGT